MIFYNTQTELFDGDGIKELRLVAEKAALLFADNGWTWTGSDEPPDADRIVGHLITLTVSAVNGAIREGRYSRWSSGRLYAEARRPDPSFHQMSLAYGIDFPL